MIKVSSFNRLNGPAFLLLIMPFFLISAGCKKKERLSASTFNFSVTPPAASLLKTESITLTAKGTSASTTIDVNPSWTLSSDTVGSLNTAIGPTVVFTAAALGDEEITVTYDGITTTSHIAVVAFRSSDNTFDVYTDNGLPAGSGITSDIFTSGSFLQELHSGYTPEGINFMRATDAPNSGFWGVTLDATNTNQSKDLSGFSSGRLKFAIRFGRNLTGAETFRIDINTNSSYLLAGGGVDFSRLSTDWQEISIPFSSFSPTPNFSQIEVPFTIVTVALGSNLTFDVDAVRWEK